MYQVILYEFWMFSEHIQSKGWNYEAYSTQNSASDYADFEGSNQDFGRFHEILVKVVIEITIKTHFGWVLVLVEL